MRRLCINFMICMSKYLITLATNKWKLASCVTAIKIRLVQMYNFMLNLYVYRMNAKDLTFLGQIKGRDTEYIVDD